jgi:hypothetical protein
MKIALTACFAATVAVTAVSGWAQDLPSVSVESIPAGVPLRVELEKSYHMRVGTQIEGHLTEPVYLVDHVVLPQDSKVFGSITGKHSVTRKVRAAAMFNGDLTPLKEADVTFNEVQTPDGRQFQIETDATERTTSVVRMSSEDAKPPRRSLGQQIAAAFRWTKNQTIGAVKAPHKADALRQMLYKEVPFHPQEVWVGTQYDANLLKPLELQGQPAVEHVPAAELSELKLSGTIEARLLDPVDSATAKPGTPVEAVLTQPLFEEEATELVERVSLPATPGASAIEATSQTSPRKQHKLLVLPEGTHLIGTVVQAKAAGMFGRNGSLRLSFRKVELPQGDERVVQGQMTAAEGIKADHIQLDNEGGAKATNGVARFLTPVSLGSLASVEGTGSSLIREAMASNGLNALTEVLGTAISSAGLINGFGYYEAGKVIFDQWIGRGHDVTFARNTRIEIALTQHDNNRLVSEQEEALLTAPEVVTPAPSQDEDEVETSALILEAR